MTNTSTTRRAAFTLIEATIAIALAVTAAGVLLMGVTTSQQTTDEALKRTIAVGIAEQLIDEILGRRYCEDPTNGYQASLGPNAWETSGFGRQRYNDIDDYHGVRTQPPTDHYSVALGLDNGEGGQRHSAFKAPAGLMDRWRQEVDVYYVRENDLGARLTGQTSDYRMVEVRITEEVPGVGRRELAKLKRVVAYVPPLP